MMKRVFSYIAVILMAFAVMSCLTDAEKLSEMEEYTGPRYESTNVHIVVSDSSVVKMEMSGARQLTFLNGDLEFPEGIKITFYDVLGGKTSELTAQRGYYDTETKLYRVEGDVIVNNLQKKETLSTEELFWDREKKTIYTDKFVTVKTVDDLLFAEGMDSDQNFENYTFRKLRDSEIEVKGEI
ncbi:MAG: LPS export ABC transporter periplasmic protein LptC [Roseivirga sp.]